VLDVQTFRDVDGVSGVDKCVRAMTKHAKMMSVVIGTKRKLEGAEVNMNVVETL
jgi:hypothetical protein